MKFSDGDNLEPGAVIWATGFRTNHSWIDVPAFDEDGRVVHQRGVTRIARPLFPRPHVDAHQGLSADRLGRGRCRVPRSAISTFQVTGAEGRAPARAG